MTRYLLNLALILAVVSPSAAFPKLPAPAKKPEYLGVGDALAANVRTPPAGAAGATSFLGIAVEADAKGQLVVEGVAMKSPAENAGVKPKDIVVAIGGNSVRTPVSFREWVQSYFPGEKIAISLIRDGKPMEVSATLEPASRPKKPGIPAYLGVRVGEFKEGEGAKIDSVAEDSPASAAGLKVGDFITKLNNEDLRRSSMLTDLLEEKQPGDVITIVVRREGKDLPAISAKLAANRPMGKGGAGGPRETVATLWKKPEMKIAIVGLGFSDIKNNSANNPDVLEKLFVSRSSADSKDPPSLNDYMHEISAGAFQFKKEGKRLTWVEVAKKRSDYGQGSGVSNKTAPLVDALDKLVAREGKTVLDNLDALFFVYAGELVRGNAGAVYTPHTGSVFHSGKRLPYLFVPEGGSTLSNVRVFAKEACKLLGLPDLAARSENVASEGLGQWCVLSDIKSGQKPQHPSAWAKERMGWLTPTVIDPTVKQKLVLNPIRGSNRECFKILVRPDGSEYLLLENRVKAGFDSDLPAEGLLIWRVMNGRPQLIESHGVDGPTGPNVHLPSVPFPSPANTSLTPYTTPTSKSPQAGGLPIHITSIKRSADGKITFQIGYEFE